MIIELDRESLLVHVSAHTPFDDVEHALAQGGLTLDARYDGTIAAWLADGAPGARSAWLDPVDHLVAGWVACIRDSQRRFTVHPAPRRAVGPDLLSLVFGAKGRFLALESVWLRVHRVNATRPTTLPFTDDSEPLSPDELALYDAVEKAL